jgi:hypothetical protein
MKSWPGRTESTSLNTRPCPSSSASRSCNHPAG